MEFLILVAILLRGRSGWGTRVDNGRDLARPICVPMRSNFSGLVS